MRIGVISDTHGLLRPEALERLAGVGHILHAGDIGGSGIVPALCELAPTTAVRGNVDTEPWAAAFPETATVELDGTRIHLLHDAHALAIDLRAAGIALVVAGHSHRPGIETRSGVLHLNPGSAGRRRFRLPVTLAIVEVAGAEIRPRIVGLVAAAERPAARNR